MPFSETKEGQTHVHCTVHKGKDEPCCCHHSKPTKCEYKTFSGTATFTAHCRTCSNPVDKCDWNIHDLAQTARFAAIERHQALQAAVLFVVAVGLLVTALL